MGNWLKTVVQKYGQGIVFLVAVAWILAYMWPILRPEYYFEGWDTMGHYYLFLQMRDYLLHGTFHGYNPDLFGGYPEFYLYGPLPYFLPALLYVLGGGLLSTALIFKLFMVIQPIVLVYVLQYVAKIHFGRTSAIIMTALSIFYLSPSNDFFMVGYGMQSIVEAGLIANMLGIIFLVLYLSSLVTNQDEVTVRTVVKPALLMTVTILSHVLTGVFALFTTFVFLIANHNKITLYRTILILLLSFFLGSFWFIPFLQLLPFSSSAVIGQNGFETLIILFPNLFEGIGQAWATANPLYIFSTGLLFAVGIVAAILLRLKHRVWWWWYAAAILLLPRDLLADTLPFPFHYFRFNAQIFVVHLFLVAAGLTGLIHLKKGRQQIVLSLVLAIVFGILFHTEAAKNLYQSSSFVAMQGIDYPEREYADEVMQQLGSGSQFVLSEQSMDLQRRLGSVHYFPFVMTMTTGHRSMTGLLAESSLSHAFVSPAWSAVTNSLSWSEPLQFGLRSDTIEARWQKAYAILNMYPISKFIVTSTPALRTMRAWEEAGYVAESHSSGRFTVYTNLNAPPLASTSDKLPFLYVEKGGLSFQHFLAHLYTKGYIMPGQFAFSNTSIANIPSDHWSQFSGIVVSLPSNTAITVQDIEYYRQFHPNVIFVGGRISRLPANTAINFQHIPDLNTAAILPANVFSPTKLRESFELPVTWETGNRLSFQSSGATVVRLSYSPLVKLNDVADVYWLSPSHMYIINTGASSIRW